jgi:acetyl esterase/lipase
MRDITTEGGHLLLPPHRWTDELGPDRDSDAFHMTNIGSAPYENPFVVSIDDATERRRFDDFDLYQPRSGEPAPCIVFVHGPADGEPRPREWPVFQGYGRLAAQSGAVGAVADLDYNDWRATEGPTRSLRELVETVRRHAGVDGDRVALWAFSAGASLVSPWLSSPPEWLRCVAMSYPVIAPVHRVAASLVVTQVEYEQPEIQAAVDLLLMQAAGPLELITVAGAQHGFDFLDSRPNSADAVRRAMRTVYQQLGERLPSNHHRPAS